MFFSVPELHLLCILCETCKELTVRPIGKRHDSGFLMLERGDGPSLVKVPQTNLPIFPSGREDLAVGVQSNRLDVGKSDRQHLHFLASVEIPERRTNIA